MLQKNVFAALQKMQLDLEKNRLRTESTDAALRIIHIYFTKVKDTQRNKGRKELK